MRFINAPYSRARSSIALWSFSSFPNRYKLALDLNLLIPLRITTKECASWSLGHQVPLFLKLILRKP